MKKGGPVDLDRAWFKKNPTRNFRVRRAADGEVEDLIRRQVPSSGYELVGRGVSYPPPSEDHEWRILVINVASDTLARMVMLREKGASDDLGNVGETGTALAVILGGRLVLERKAG